MQNQNPFAGLDPNKPEDIIEAARIAGISDYELTQAMPELEQHINAPQLNNGKEEGFWSETVDYVQDRAGDFAGNAMKFVGRGIDEFNQASKVAPINIGGIGAPLAGLMQSDIGKQTGQALQSTGQALIDDDFGFDAQNNQYSWEQVKADPSVSTIAGYITREGLGSVPEMVAMLNPYGLAAYGASAIERIATERAQNDGRDKANAEDYSIAAPTAAAVVLMDKLGFDKAREVVQYGVKEVAKKGGLEALTEFGQESLESTATTLGTEKGFNLANTLDAGFAGAVAGGGMGAAINTGSQALNKINGVEAGTPVQDIPFEQKKADFEAKIKRVRQAGMEAEQRGDSPESIQRLRDAYTTVNRQYNEFLAKNDPNYVKPTQQAQSAQEQAKEEAKAQGGDALTQEVAATTTAGTEVPKAVDEELRIQRERAAIRQENAKFDTPAIARKVGLMENDAGNFGDELLLRDAEQRQVRARNASMLAPQELPKAVVERVFGEDSQYRSGTDNAKVKSNGTPFPTAKSVQITPKYKQAVEQGLNPEIVKVGNGYGWELNNDTERDTGSLRGNDNQQTGSIGVGLPQQGQRDDAIADTANNNGLDNGQVDPMVDGRDGNDSALGVIATGRDEEFGIDVALKKNNDNEYEVVTSDQNQRNSKVSIGLSGIFLNENILNMDGELVPPSSIIQGSTGYIGPESTPFKGTKQQNEQAAKLIANIEFERNKGNTIKVDELESQLFDLVNSRKKSDKINDNALEPQTETEVGNLRIVEAPLNELTLSPDVPQFKSGADKNGVTERLEGKYDRTGTGPIQIWVRNDGRKEIISGRHRFDLAKRDGQKTIPAQYHYEANGFTKDDAASLDAILNIRDGQGKVKDYVNYFKYSNTTRQEAESEGLLARRLGQRAYTIANEGTENLISQHANDQITDEEAYRIAKAAPGNVDLQNVGIKARQEGKTIAVAENMMRALSYMSEGQMTGGTFDLFGDNDAALIEAEQLAKAAAQKQADIAKRLSAIRGAAKNPKLAAQEGIDIRDEQALNNRIQALQQEKNDWDNWHTDTAKVEQLRSELGLSTQPTDFGLTQESEQDRIEREQAEQQAQAEAQQAQQSVFDQQDADAQVDDFTLTGSNQPADIAMSQGQNDLFGASPDTPQNEPTTTQASTEAFLNGDAKGGRTKWNNFPDVIIHAKNKDATQHPDYKAAKGGDLDAAVRLVDDLVDVDSLSELSKLIDKSKGLIVAVHADESVSKNKIPNSLALLLEQEIGINVDDQVIQSKYAGRGNQDGFQRIANKVDFDGEVIPGAQYLLVDDTLTQGGTFASLKGYIESKGGIVVGATALTGKQYSARLQPSQTEIEALREQYRDSDLERWFENELGYGFDYLTASEVRYLRQAKDADKIRTKITEGRSAGVDSVRQVEVPEQAEGTESQTQSTTREPLNSGFFNTQENLKFKSNGQPFTTEKLARASKAFKQTPNAEVVAVDGGFAVKEVEATNNTETARSESQSAGPIKDFGEKLEGARKDIKRVFKPDLDDGDIQSQPLSKIWPKDAFENIGDKFAEAFAYAARQEIPNKPRKGYNLARWVESVKAIHSLVQDNIVDGLMTGNLSAERIKELMKSRPELSSFASKVELLENIDKGKWSRIGDVGVYQGIRYVDDKEIPSKWVRIEIDNRMQTFYFDENLNETFDAINDALAGDKPTQTMQFEIRGRKGNYFINKKGDKDYTRLVEFTDLADARAYKRDNYDDLVGKWEAHKERYNVKKSDVRGKNNAPRVGADHRGGKDITPEQFQDAFGFRGVQFGNWVNKDKERQQSLNDAYDGLMDLAGILNIPSKAISLEGKLGLAFGARGNGGRAAAHYETGSVVINLTKTKGAGSLAHEWFHALDNYFGNKRYENAQKGADSTDELFITYKPEQMMVHKDYPQSKLTKAKLAMRREQNPTTGYFAESNWIPDPEHPNGVRQVVEARFAELVETLEQSPMSERSSRMDRTPNAYWSQIIERGARAFENYIINKMRNNNEKNDYLANVVSIEDFARDPERYPYLLDNEIEPVEKAFDALFETIETKEDSDGNVTLFSTNPNNNPTTATNRTTVTFADANKVVERIVSGLSGSAARKGEIVLLDSYSALPQAIQDAAKGYDAEGRINGVFHNGKTYVVLDQHSTPEEVETTIFHELYGHNGIRRLFGQDIVRSLNKVFVAIGGMKGLKETAERNNINLDDYISAAGGMNQEFAQTMLMEELLAHLQQDNKPSVKRFVKETIGLIREKLRQLGFAKLAKYNDTDLFYLLKQARNAVQKDTKGNSLVVGSDSPMFSTNSNLDMSKEARLERARDMGFDTNTVWYHGTGSDFTEFDLDKTGSHSDTGMIGRGFYFSNNPRISGEYAARGKQPNVIPVYLKSDSPFVVRDLNNDLPEIVTPNETLDDYMNAAKAYSQQLRDWAIENGYDSIVYEKPTGNKEIVVFEPNQIRSVNAEFDTEKSSESDIRFSINNNQNNFSTPQFETKLQKAGDWFVRNLQDKFKPIKDIQKSITDYRGSQLDDNENTYQAEELFYGKAENDLRQVEESLIKPLIDEMAATGIEQSELDLFLIAKHAKERNAYIASINPDMPDGGSGMTNAEAQQILTQATIDGKYDQLESLANKVYAITNRRKQLAEQAGLIDEGEWDNDWQFYVPLKGIANDQEGASRPRTGKGFDIRGNESLRAMGRRSKAESPLQHAISDLAQSIIRKRKNEVGQTFLNMVEGNPNPELWQVFTDDNPDTERGMVNGEVVPDKPVDMRYRKDDYLAIKRNGTQYYVKVADKRIMNAMKNIGPSEMNTVTKVMSSVTRWLSTVNTSLNPEFMVTNSLRDIQTAVMNAMAEQDIADGKVKGQKLAGKMAAGAPRAAKALWQHARGTLDPTSEEAIYIEEFLADGAKTGYFDSKDIDQIGSELENLLDMAKGNLKGNALKAKKKVTDFIENANGAVENGVRLSAYMEARKAGISRDKAASFAKNLTVNFNRKGEAGNALNAMYMFFNAAVQGNANFLRAMATMSIDPNTGKKKLNPAQKIAAGIVGASAALAYLNREAGGEDDDGVPYWDKVPKYVRERNLVIMKGIYGGDEGEYWKIPLPYGYNIFANMGDAIEGAVNSKTRGKGEILGDLALSAWTAFVPLASPEGDGLAQRSLMVGAPTITKPFLEIGMNTNAFGAPIFREEPGNGQGPKLTESNTSMRSTAEPYKWLSKFMNEVTGGSEYISGGIDVSPDKIEHLMEFAFGGIYRFGARVTDNTVDAINGVPLDTNRTPFTRMLDGELTPYDDFSQFYDARQEVNNLEAQRKVLRGQERIDFMREYGDKIRLQGVISSTYKRMRLLRKQRDRIEVDESLSMAERERQLDKVEQKMKEAVAVFNKRWNEVN